MKEMMPSYYIIIDALRWAFIMLGKNIELYIKLVLVSGLIVFIGTLFSLGILFFLVSFYITLCFVKTAFMLDEGEKVTLNTFWVGVVPFIKCWIALILYGLMVTIGLIFFILPGLYLASRYYYIIYCMMGDNATILGSFSCSEKLTRGNCLHAFYLFILATLFGSTFMLIPVAALMNVYAYKQRKASLSQ
jgi:hypothetical protein